jgi:transcriptional regulator with XRE-family HTH domain
MRKTSRRRRRKPDTASRLLLVLVRYHRGWYEKSQLAEILGVAPSLVSMWERGNRAIQRKTLEHTFDKAALPRPLIDPALRAIRSFQRAAHSRGRTDRTLPLAAATDTLPLLLAAADLILEPLLQTHRQSTATDPELVEDLWARLKRRSPADRLVLVEDGREYWNQALCEKVAAESRKLAETQPRESQELARLAEQIAERIG